MMLAVAVSLDSFGVGLTYGLRRIKIPLVSLFFIGLCSAVSVLLAMAMGSGVAVWLSPHVAEMLGALILIGLGVWALVQTYRPKCETESVDLNAILKDPARADMDRSGTVIGKEAFLLGFALALDAFAAGVGAALIGFSPLGLAGSVAVMGALFVFLGMKCGYLSSKVVWLQRLSFVPGIMLILLGIARL